MSAESTKCPKCRSTSVKHQRHLSSPGHASHAIKTLGGSPLTQLLVYGLGAAAEMMKHKYKCSTCSHEFS